MSRLREAVRAAELDGLVVTHLPNVFYLTNFQGTAGIAVVVHASLYLLLDFRYSAAAKEFWDSPYGCPDAEIVPVERTYDETLTALIKRLEREAAWYRGRLPAGQSGERPCEEPRRGGRSGFRSSPLTVSSRGCASSKMP